MTTTPKVRIARPSGQPFQIRYMCPIEKREIRRSVGCRDEDKAQAMKAEIEARLLLGIPMDRKKVKAKGPYMAWDDFRDAYAELQLTALRRRSSNCAESRLDIAERILRPCPRRDSIAESQPPHRCKLPCTTCCEPKGHCM